ncbi:MAG: TlpA family protein disulfide reductase [Rhodomicrobium sp.]
MKANDETENGNQSQGPSPVRLGLYAAACVFSVASGFYTALWLRGDGERSVPPIVAEREAGFSAPAGQLVRRAEPQAMPDLVFSSADGKPHHLSEWRGKVVLLNLWATWCAPCKAEMPSLDRLQAKLGSDAFTVLAISVDRTGMDKPASFFAGNGITHLTLYNDNTSQTLNGLRVSGLPVSVILNREGREAARLIGPADWDGPRATAQIEEFLNAGRGPG